MQSIWLGGASEDFMKSLGSSDAVVVPSGKWVFAGGQVGQDVNGNTPEDLRGQTF